jgi:hypothetical protein
MTPRAMIYIALVLAVLALILFFMDVPRWLPPRVQPLPLDAGNFTVVTARPPPRIPAPGCGHHAKRICEGGDVWWLDGCGALEELDENCDDTICVNGKCVQDSGPPCENLSEGGRCDGNILRYCDHGRAREVDCGDKKCGLDREGEPNCIKPATCPDRCYGPIAEHCDESGHHLLVCDGKCELVDGHARCLERTRCGGCSCPSPSPEPIAPIDVVAYLAAGEDGRPVESEERARATIEMAMQWFAIPEHDTGLRFNLREVKILQRPDWLSATSSTVMKAEKDPELHGAPFAVPIVFVRELQIGEKKAAGLGSLPNGTCADLPGFSYHSAGVILLARRRFLTTLAHELGHYFGLCHTHQPDSRIAAQIVKNDAPLECSSCLLTGDGVCDTPIDPGTEACKLDPETCTATCDSGATPDPNNLMSYFVACRKYFSDEQIGHLRKWARWRLSHQ